MTRLEEKIERDEQEKDQTIRNIFEKNKKKFILGGMIFVFLIVILNYTHEKPDEQRAEGENTSTAEEILVKKPEVESAEEKKWQEYKNEKYNYSVRYPDDVKIITKQGQDPLTEIDINGQKIERGGAIFWSNYENISSFTPENKPSDFYLLSFTPFKVQDAKMDTMTKILGFGESEIDVVVFKAGDREGLEVIADGIDKENPKVAIIFQKESMFYVFQFAFVNGRVNVIDLFEEIASEFVLN